MVKIACIPTYNNRTLFLYFPLPAERNAVVEEAIIEAKAHSNKREEMRKAKAQAVTAGPVKISAKHFKYVSKEARRQGEARLRVEDMVRRAEKKLAEMERKSHASVQSAEAKAEELATELFHKPGSMLKKEEIARIMTEAGCAGREEPTCPDAERFRTIDGTCNNGVNPLLGAANTALVRLIPSQYENGITSFRGGLQARNNDIFGGGPYDEPNPSARQVSVSVIHSADDDEVFTHILMQWGQFIDHDLSLTPELEDKCDERAKICEFTDICEPIFVEYSDPIFGKGTDNNGHCMHFSRSLPACVDENEPLVHGAFRPREQINVLTSFIDGSMIYGSDQELEEEVRLYKGGLLREGQNFPGSKPELPRISDTENTREDGSDYVGCSNPGKLGCFLAGDFRVNEQLGLTMMHTIWFREHNRIARELGSLNSQWNDERVFQEARRIVGALIQKITYVDYLPLLFGQDVFEIVLGEYDGYDPRINPGVSNVFSTAAYRYGHTLIRSAFERLGSNYLSIGAGPLDLFDAFFNPDQFRVSFGTDPIMRGLVTENARRVDEFLTTTLTDHLLRNELDLASLNIQRGRDHGLPPYITWQRYCNTTFPRLPLPDFSNFITFIDFLKLYGSLDTVDLWIGGLAEKRLVGSVLGPTFSCLFGIAFGNIRDGDGFFYKRPGQFESQQLEQIEQDTLSRVVCENSDGITKIQENAFLTGMPRVPCSSLPRINLNLWKEEGCNFILYVVPHKSTFTVNTFSRSSRLDNYVSVSITFAGSFFPKSECVPIECPKKGGSTDFSLSLTDRLGRVIKNNPLPPSKLLIPSTYVSSLPESLFDNGQGFFRSESACRASNLYAFTIQPSFLLSAQELELAQQASSEADTEFSKVDEPMPEYIKILLDGENTEVQSSIPTAEFETEFETESETEFETESETESDAQLMSDLEEALKSLNE